MNTNARQMRTFTLDEDEEAEHGEHTALSPDSNGGGYSHRPQAIFNLDLDYSDDDALLDWEQYAGMNRVRCCGIDCSPIARRIRPPQWWHSYTKKQRRCILGAGIGLAALCAVLIALIALAALRGGSRTMGDLKTGDMPEQTEAGSTGSEQPATGSPPAAPSTAQPSASELELCSWQEYRLPRRVLPSTYNLTLEVSMGGKFEVAGSVAIEVAASKATRCVVLHAAEMVVSEARLGGPEGPKGRLTWREAEQQLILQFDESLGTAQQSVLWLAFSYNLREGLSGFYRSTYKLADGKERSLATTQFEANSARLAFPCFDEPNFKAVFNTEIIAPAAYQVLSNAPPRAVHEHEHNMEHGTRTWHFSPTPPMSTYLVCFIIGNFVSTSRVVTAGPGSVNVSVWGTPDRVRNLEYAADAAAAILPAYERALGVAFPLPKMDLVAIPDFSAGAMENWGLITYRETALLTSPSSSLVDKRYVTLVVAHELAHQWFGNLVTCDYWSELWLNEGFASYFEYIGATAAHPDSQFFSTFYTDNVPYGQYFDSKRCSHPLSMDAARMNSTDAIESVFDAVSYQKGASVLRMLRSFINRNNKQVPPPQHEVVPGATYEQDRFLAGLKHYLELWQYKTASADALWGALSETLKLDVSGLMQQWTYHQGYPVVQASKDNKGRVHLRQAPFSLQGSSAGCQEDGSNSWWIPISYVTSEDPQVVKWTELKSCQGKATLLTLGGNVTWFKLNVGQYGFYRVNYAIDGMYTQLAAATRMAAAGEGGGMLLSGADMAGLFEDAYSLAEAGDLPVTHFLDLLLSLQARPPGDYEPWAATLPYIYKMQRLLSCSTDWTAWMGTLLQSYLSQPPPNSGGANATTQLLFSFAPNEASVPAAQQDMGYRLLRPAILKAAGLFGNIKIKAAAVNMLTLLEAEGSGERPSNTIEADVRSAVYQTAASSRDWEVYNQLQEMYKEAADADEKQRLLLALGYAPGDRVQSTLAFALTPDVRAQDVRSLVVTTAANGGPGALNLTWAWLQQKHDALFAKLGGDDEAARRLAQAAEGVASLFGDAARQGEVDKLFADFSAAHGRQSDPGYAARAKESVAANARWLDLHDKEACAWIEGQRQAQKGG